MNLHNNLLLDFLEKMYLIRNFEIKILDYANRGLIAGAVHLCIGEEASAVGTGMNLKKDDYVIVTHRGHGQAIVKGSDIKKLMAEIFGRNTGLNNDTYMFTTIIARVNIKILMGNPGCSRGAVEKRYAGKTCSRAINKPKYG